MKISRTLIIILIIATNIAVDQISKVIVRGTFEYGKEHQIIGDPFKLIYVENSGAFLGFGSDLHPALRLIFLIILPVLVLGYVVFYIIKNKELNTLSLVALCCIIGGGIANIFDRIVYGKVTDFLFIDLGGVFKTGIFNIADVSVTFGMIILLTANFLNRRKNKEVR